MPDIDNASIRKVDEQVERLLSVRVHVINAVVCAGFKSQLPLHLISNLLAV